MHSTNQSLLLLLYPPWSPSALPAFQSAMLAEENPIPMKHLTCPVSSLNQVLQSFTHQRGDLVLLMFN